MPGELGLDCTYCHYTVKQAAFAAVPGTQVCMGCHLMVRDRSPRLELVRQSYATGDPIEWLKIHDLPDYVYFNHSAHVQAGVSCVSCHGRDRPNGRSGAGGAVEHGLVSGMPPQSGAAHPAGR